MIGRPPRSTLFPSPPPSQSRRPATRPPPPPFTTHRRTPRMTQALTHNRLPPAAASHWLRTATMAAGIALACAGASAASDQPGKGVKVSPLKSSIAEESFQTLIVMKALEKLGYDVQDRKSVV